MTYDILSINGAIREKGNTDILIEKFIEGAESIGANTIKIQLRNINIGNCVACYKCNIESKCSVNDSMNEIRNYIENSQILLFASPLYWCGVTGIMKTFIDRLFYYYHPNNKIKIAGKGVIAITPMNQTNVDHESAPIIEFYNRLFYCLGLKILGMKFYGGIMEKGSVLKRPDYLDQAFMFGKSMHHYLNS